jgi:hypothetical protein
MRRFLTTATMVLAVGILAGFAWAYAHSRSHATLSISVADAGDTAHALATAPVDLEFLDASGSTLARATRDPSIGGVYLSWPPEYGCHAVERVATLSVEGRSDWKACFERQSRWIARWIDRVSVIDIRIGPCSMRQAPPRIDRYPDAWWLWWSPNPHVGGTPYTNYFIYLRADSRRCAVRS